MYEDEFHEIQEGCKRSLHKHSFGQIIDQNVFQLCTECQLIGTPGWGARRKFVWEVFLCGKSL